MDMRRRALVVVVAIVSVFVVGRWIFGPSPEPVPARQPVASAEQPVPSKPPAPAPVPSPSATPKLVPPPAEPPSSQAPAKALGAPVKLLSHRAVYDLKLKSARANAGVSSLEGRMVMEWGDSCDGSTLNQRIETRAFDTEGNPLETDFRISTWEAHDGHAFRFSARQETDGDVTEEFEGKGVKGDDGSGEVTYTKPPEKSLKLGTGALFPTEHTTALIQAALASKAFLTAKVFDGSGPDTAYEAIGAIGKEHAADTGDSPGKGAEMLKGISSWPMRLAYYPVGKIDGLPEYEIGFRMYANGVSTDLELDYGEFTISGVLNQLEALPDPGC